MLSKIMKDTKDLFMEKKITIDGHPDDIPQRNLTN